MDNGRVRCDLCPRHCTLKDGQCAFCFVRQARDGNIALTTYGRSTGFCIDPIEKKPLNHFYPGSSVLSFGTAGCNLGCRFCQNWDMSKAREVTRLSDAASPQEIAQSAKQSGCTSVAFTYNDPVIFYEYAVDTAIACHALDIKTVAVTAGYITDQARPGFFEHMDAANVDLKSFSENFYRHQCYGELQPVLDTLTYLVRETHVWVEITNLLIPGANDSDEELSAMCQWLATNLGTDVPIHFTAFHPDFKMLNKPRTPTATLSRARNAAIEAGLHYVFTGNVSDPKGQSTYCPNCEALLIERNGYDLGHWGIQNGACKECGTRIPGRFADKPGDWGGRRRPVHIR
ncbi:MAG: AmmeMemoRadiSam system radical SAM enzyme [Deltaproteobacteria bacterium RIFOXYA12_FULL_58_15]|nr:MAG: AmmeMemoRadiSam system radical SAM enzyme [Deltaproteobacteria bacterium RIFOXYA12_FULL_58_15]OGR08643.1 MAG: AmmeMemoRadiSam system radical SAM enzyme [Deltaproteobacteria bacterium RIFOXYB12_FULL_58_9]